ncbi:MAG: hypothetical protein IPJ21_14355 [Sterolibacteriaceae bacterium]|nr:hypothetical protein [Sterolibacteriaceae bacterium]
MIDQDTAHQVLPQRTETQALVRAGFCVHAALHQRRHSGVAGDLAKLRRHIDLRAGKRVCALSIPSNDAPSDLSQRAEGTASIVDLMVNARVAAVPDVLRDIVEACLRAWTDTHSRGTTHLKDFRARAGATTVYVNASGERAQAAVRKSHLGPSKAPLTRGLNTRKKYDARLPLDQFVSQKDALEKLRDMPFGLGITVNDWGVHTFVYSYGSIYEVHWDKGPQSKEVFEQRPLEEFMAKWGSVVIAVPRGPWNYGPAPVSR